ncbi:cathepsin B-like [Aplysia californica]|uniref:Cathepsin B-like n=1 Tax=Aplysia californica TaxID=6500 RepID=A0ABM1VUJ2_APLCA|nr:cathepsin B-like [Aplysia californica]
MHQLFPLCLLVAAAVASPANYQMSALGDDMIFYINHVANTTWKAGRNFQPQELNRVKSLLGVNMEKNRVYNRKHLKYQEVWVSDDLPKEFDPRKKWPKCQSLSEVRDQSTCGSCWAFGSVEAMTDRICIAGGGAVHISAEDMNSCCDSCGMGCNGGYPAAAWDWYVKTGVVTGGQYGSKQGCLPYSLAHCDHHVKGKYQPCGPVVPTPKCTKQCEAGYSKSYNADKQFGSTSYGVRGVDQIAQELVSNGPVTAAFDVFEDFLSYKTGVYKHVTGQYLGGHAIKIIGYGVENGQDYWLVTNSWNEDWGDKGYFKIAKGSDECSIEDMVVTGKPKL